MNGLVFLVAVVALGLLVAIPWAMALDRRDAWVRDLQDLDDDELAAVLEEFPDLFERRKR